MDKGGNRGGSRDHTGHNRRKIERKKGKGLTGRKREKIKGEESVGSARERVGERENLTGRGTEKKPEKGVRWLFLVLIFRKIILN